MIWMKLWLEWSRKRKNRNVQSPDIQKKKSINYILCCRLNNTIIIFYKTNKKILEKEMQFFLLISRFWTNDKTSFWSFCTLFHKSQFVSYSWICGSKVSVNQNLFSCMSFYHLSRTFSHLPNQMLE